MFSPTVNAPLTWWEAVQPAGREPVVLLDQRLCANAEFGAVIVGPPVDQVAVAVIFGTLVVETVADLMADDRPDAAVVGGVVGLGVEERRLQDRRGKDDLVHSGVVVGVDGLRRHEPLVAVDGTAELGQIALVLQRVAALVVAVQVVTGDDERRVVAPLRGVADLRRELVEFLQRPLPGLRRHPLQVGDADAVGLPQIGHQFVHPRLGVRRKVPLDVEPAHGVAHQALDQTDAALPPVTKLLGARQRAAVEREVLLDEVVVEQRSPPADHSPAQPALPVLEVLVRPQRGEYGQRIRLTDDDLSGLIRRGTQCVQPHRPVETGCLRVQFGESAQVVGQVGVASLHHIPVRGRDLGLQRDDLRGGRVPVRVLPP